jgi:ATPase, P-type (transporting), HAD superfamily, subfamily IC/heavy metal translocating P-type ATPase
MKIRYPVPTSAAFFIIVGAASSFLPDGSYWRPRIWMAGLAVTAIPMLWGTLREMIRGKFAADVVAALAVIGAVLLRQPIVGLVIVLMQTGGQALEHLAEGKASDALRALEKASPKIVHLVRGETVEDVDVDQVEQDDVVLVRAGEMVPCDGEVTEGTSHLDTASITGEPVPRRIEPGSAVMSGSVNQHAPVKIRVTAIAAESQYARIVALVREAQGSKAPLQRVADRYAVMFTPFTLITCAVAYGLSRDWERVLAVLAIATPCPLILAAPVAILGGFNRAARNQILIRNGGALEALGSVTSMVFDKTGTITIGRPEVSRVVAIAALQESEILRLASGVEQGSSHLLARTLIARAQATGVVIPVATGVVETPGRGVEGEVGPSRVTVGARSFVDERNPHARVIDGHLDHGGGGNDQNAALRAYVAVDGDIVGFVEYADMVRPGMRDVIDRLRGLGISSITLLSGDRSVNVREVAQSVGITDFRGDMLPEEKLQVVNHLLRNGERVAMMGDGTNDAPALGTATVGVALASHGRGIATEAADVIVLADDPGRIVKGIIISRRTMRIAKQSIIIGLGISAAGMVLALLGYVAPVIGAGIQEAVDLAVILNALRASRDTAGESKENPHESSVEPRINGGPEASELRLIVGQ